MQESLLEIDDLLDNPTPRVPVSLCLDCSGSMSGAPIAELNEGVRTFYEALNSDEIARFCRNKYCYVWSGSERNRLSNTRSKLPCAGACFFGQYAYGGGREVVVRLS